MLSVIFPPGFLKPIRLATRFAGDKAEVLEQATDLVLKIALDLDQLGPAWARPFRTAPIP